MSIKSKDASLALYGQECESGRLLSHRAFCLPQSRSLCYDGNTIAYQKVCASYLRLAAGHVIALLHNMPDLPGDGAVGNNHYARWYHQDQQQHVHLVEAPEWRRIHNRNTVVRLAFLSYYGVILTKKKLIYVSCVMRAVATLDILFPTQRSWSEPQERACVFPYLSLFIYPTVLPSIHPPIHPSLPTYLPTYPPTHLHTYLPT